MFNLNAGEMIVDVVKGRDELFARIEEFKKYDFYKNKKVEELIRKIEAGLKDGQFLSRSVEAEGRERSLAYINYYNKVLDNLERLFEIEME